MERSERKKTLTRGLKKLDCHALRARNDNIVDSTNKAPELHGPEPAEWVEGPLQCIRTRLLDPSTSSGTLPGCKYSYLCNKVACAGMISCPVGTIVIIANKQQSNYIISVLNYSMVPHHAQTQLSLNGIFGAHHQYHPTTGD